MKNFVRFTDFFTTKTLVIQDGEKRDGPALFSFGNPTSRRYRATGENLNGIPQVLGVKIAATHSGKVTGNNGFYLPDKMQAAAGSWMLPFPKPILLHHEAEDDAIGRVEEARYVDISNGFKQDFVKRKDKVFGNTPSDTLIDAFLKGELSPRECVDVVNNIFLVKDFNYTKDPSYPGLGYIELTASISEPDSIRKIMDKRFLTGSIGARTDAAVCSVCKKDWANDEQCEHRPGKEYKGILCALIAGNLMYDEYSYVNRPADVHSKTIEIFQNNEIKNSLDLGSWMDSIPEVGFNIVDSLTIFNEEQPAMTIEKVIELLKNFLTDKFSELLPLIDVQKLAEKFFDKHAASGLTEEQFISEFTQQLNKYNLSFEDAEDLLGENPTDEDYQYVDMLIDAKIGLLDMSEEEVAALLDAKLSSKARKGLSSSTFCAPNRGFPIPDCCFFGPQKVRTLDGKDISIKEIVEKIDNKEEVWVYGFDLSQKSIVPKRITAAWKARTNAEVLKITLDNGEEIVCTHNHPFLTRNMDYVQASNLIINQSLMPFYWKKQEQYSRENAVYEKIFQPYYRYWEYTHHMVAREKLDFYGNCNNKCIHHINEDKINNIPSNLQVLTRSKHILKHKQNFKKVVREFTPDQIRARSNFMKNRMAHILGDETLSSAHSSALSKGRRTYDWDNIHGEIGNSGMTIVDIYLARKLGVQLKFIADRLQIKSETIKNWLKKADFSNVEEKTNDIVISLVEDYFSYIFGQSLEKIYEDYTSNPNFSALQDKYKIDRFTLRQWFKKAGFEIDRTALGLKVIKEDKNSILSKWKNGEITLSWLKNRIGNQELTANDFYNHKVISIETYPSLEDVYDIEVEDTNNFALSAGVFVHNSHVTAGRRLLGRYKGPGDKKTILACINRKAQRMGCDKGKEDQEDVGVGQFTVDYFDNYEDREVLQMVNGLELVLSERKLSNPSGCAEVKNRMSSLESENKELKENLSSFKETRTELKNTTEDNKNLKDELFKVMTLIKDTHVNNVIFLKKLKGEETTEEQKNELSGKTIIDLTDMQNTLEKDIGIEKLCDMLKLGMARQPEGIIPDPTLKKVDGTLEDNNDNSNIEKEVKITKDYLMQIQHNYLTIRMRDGLEEADAYINSLKASGYLPLDTNGIIDSVGK